jgi:hypothetical protein
MQSALAGILAAAAVLACAATLRAANLHLEVQYAGSYDSAFNPLPGSPPAPLFAQNAPHPGAPGAIHVPGAYHRFDVYMTITGLAGSGTTGQDFQSVKFDFDLGPGVTPSDRGYDGANYQHDPPGPFPPTNLFSQNGDAGPAVIDLKFISIIANSANNHSGTHHRHPGENEPAPIGHQPLPPPTLLGSAYVFWDGTTDARGKSWVGVSLSPDVPDPWSDVQGNTVTPHPAADMTLGPRSEWFIFIETWLGVEDASIPPGTFDHPHPAPVTAGEVLTHQFSDNGIPAGEVTWSDFGLASFTPLIPGATNPPMNATFDPDTQLFTWDTTGFARGAYDFVVTATEGGLNSDQGHLYVTIASVPEPTALALFVLAIFGLTGVGRHRFLDRCERLQ